MAPTFGFQGQVKSFFKFWGPDISFPISICSLLGKVLFFPFPKKSWKVNVQTQIYRHVLTKQVKPTKSERKKNYLPTL